MQRAFAVRGMTGRSPSYSPAGWRSRRWGSLPEDSPADRDASWHPVAARAARARPARIVDDGLWRLHARVAEKTWFIAKGGGAARGCSTATPRSTRRRPSRRLPFRQAPSAGWSDCLLGTGRRFESCRGHSGGARGRLTFA